ncbi:hypothetical protein [Microbacterium sediminicola]
MTVAKRLVILGEISLGLGGTLAIGYYIYALEAEELFWTWPGFIAISITAAGVVALTIGLSIREPRQANDHPAGAKKSGGASHTNFQAGGANSRNYQASGDMYLNSERDGHNDG